MERPNDDYVNLTEEHIAKLKELLTEQEYDKIISLVNNDAAFLLELSGLAIDHYGADLEPTELAYKIEALYDDIYYYNGYYND